MPMNFNLSDTTEGMLKQLEGLAMLTGDGHYTIMRFTTNFRCCIGTPQDRIAIHKMSEGSTLKEAIQKCICDALGLPVVNSISEYGASDGR